MRRILVLLSVLGLVGGLLSPRVAGQTPAGIGAREALRVYLETLQLVVSTIRVERSRRSAEDVTERQNRASAALLELYRATLSAHTRGRISPSQLLSAYLGTAMQEREWLSGPGREFSVELQVDVGQPGLNERGDIALVPARVTAHYSALNSASRRPFTLHPWRWLATMVAGGESHTLQRHVSGGDRAVTLAFITVREGHQWRVVLPDAAVQEIQKAPPSVALQIWPVAQVLRPGPRYAPHASVAEAGVTLTVLDVALEQDETILRLTLANGTQDAVIVADALRRATLVDEAGKESRARAPREIVTDRLAGASAVGLTLVFDPLPAASRTAALVLPDLRAGERTMTLKLPFAMRSAAYPVFGETGIPVEPLLLYLMSVLRPAAVNAADDAPLRQFYQRHLTAHTRGQIAEADFVTHWMTRAHTHWARAFGESGQIHDLDFVVGPPAYSASRDQALVPATITSRGSSSILSPPRSRVEEITFRLIREGPSWRLELPDRIVEELHSPRPAGVLARWFPSARAAEAGIGIWVRQVAARQDETALYVAMENSLPAEASLFEAMAGATLTNEQGKTFVTRMLRTTVPDRLPGRSSVTGIMAFEPIPVGSTRLVLTIPGIRVADRSLTISLPIVLVRS